MEDNHGCGQGLDGNECSHLHSNFYEPNNVLSIADVNTSDLETILKSRF
jgi:hypothetical protein